MAVMYVQYIRATKLGDKLRDLSHTSLDRNPYPNADSVFPNQALYGRLNFERAGLVMRSAS
jgi:hypothetical protein